MSNSQAIKGVAKKPTFDVKQSPSLLIFGLNVGSLNDWDRSSGKCSTVTNTCLH